HRSRSRLRRHVLRDASARLRARVRMALQRPPSHRRGGACMGARVRGRRGGQARRPRRRARGNARRAADARDRDDEAAARPGARLDARRAARVGGAAPGGGGAIRGLPGGSAGISGEEGPELQGPLGELPEPVAEPQAQPPQHPIRMLVDDDLHRSRLTVFFRLVLVIPHLVWLYFWSWAFFGVLVFNWFATLFAGRSEADVTSFNGRFVRYATHVYAYLLLIANPWPRFSGRPGTYPIDLEIDPPEPQHRLVTLFRIVLVIPAYVFAAVLSTASHAHAP